MASRRASTEAMAFVLVCTAVLACAHVTHQITEAGWGPIKVGMTPAEASAALGSPLEPRQGAPVTDECHHRTIANAPGLLFMVEGARIVRVETKARDYS